MNGHRRLGVAIARGETVEEAIDNAKTVSNNVNIIY
ncbi:MAG: phosphoribosylglycinamide formyltransferase 2 [Glaciecola sp.]